MFFENLYPKTLCYIILTIYPKKLLLHFCGFSIDYIWVKTKWTESQDMYGGKISNLGQMYFKCDLSRENQQGLWQC